MSSLLAANVAYHREECYIPFRSDHWKKENQEEVANDKMEETDSLEEFFQLVKIHVLFRREVYTLAELREIYEDVRSVRGLSTFCRAIDLKDKLLKVFGDKIMFSKIESSRSEYVFSSEDPQRLACLDERNSIGMSKSMALRKAAKIIHDSLCVETFDEMTWPPKAAKIIHDSLCVETFDEMPWPPTPQDILEDDIRANTDLLNLITWIIHPRAALDSRGEAVLSKRQRTKVHQLVHNIKSMLPKWKPAMDQVLHSVTLHAKTGSQDVVDTVHRLGYGISYSDTIFVQDKWAQWSSNRSSIIPNIIQNKVTVTHVADNIDFKNKSIHPGRETHNTNSILVQHVDSNTKSTSSKISLTSDYNFNRKDHRSFKGNPSEVPKFSASQKSAPKALNRIEMNNIAEFDASTMKNLAWVMCRKRNKDSDDVKVPAWSAFQKRTTEADASVVNVGYLPAILGSPTKMDVIYAIMTRTIDIKNELGLDFIFLEADQAIYTKVIQILFKFQKDGNNYFDGMIVRIRGFHVVICLMKTIFSRFKDCGMIQLLAEVGVGSEGTIRAAMNGSDVKEGIRYYKILYEAFLHSKIEYIVNKNINIEKDESFEELISKACAELTPENVTKLLAHPSMKQLHDLEGTMSKWIESFIEMVNLLLNIIHFQRTGNWTGYLQAIHEFLPWCFALNRHKYARDLSYHLMDMLNLENKSPEAYEYLKNGGFSGSLSGNKHTSIPMDQIIECTINRSCKDTGGISGITENVGACERWMRINHVLAALKEHLNSKIHKKKANDHVEFGEGRKKKDEDNVQRVVNGINTWVPDLWNNSPLVHISDGIAASNEMVQNVLSAKKNRQQSMNAFLDRFTGPNCEVSKYNDPIKKQTILRFEDKFGKEKSQSNTIPEDESESFGAVLARYDSLKLDMKFLMNWPVTRKPWSICGEKGKGRDPSKSLFRNNLEKLNPTSPTQLALEKINCCIVDGGRLIHIIPITNLKENTFLAWAERLREYVECLPGNTVHIVFDNYDYPDDFLTPSKGRQQKGRVRKINHLTQILPRAQDWNDFLTVDAHKQQLINLIADHFLCAMKKVAFVTKGDYCYRTLGSNGPESTYEDFNITEIHELRSLQKEADAPIALHTEYASRWDDGVCVVADDTDVLVLLLYIAEKCTSRLYLRQGTQSSKDGIVYHDVTSLYHHLGQSVCSILPAFHALTGSDYTRPFFGRSKYGIFKKMCQFPCSADLLRSLTLTNVNVKEVIDFVLHIIYSRKKMEKTPGESRYAMLFTVGKSKRRRFMDTRRLPPDEATLTMKIKRAHYVTLGWVNCLSGPYEPPYPLNFGWQLDENRSLVPIWFEGEPLPSPSELKENIAKENDIEETEEPKVDDATESDTDSESKEKMNLVIVKRTR